MQLYREPKAVPTPCDGILAHPDSATCIRFVVKMPREHVVLCMVQKSNFFFFPVDNPMTHLLLGRAFALQRHAPHIISVRNSKQTTCNSGKEG